MMTRTTSIVVALVASASFGAASAAPRPTPMAPTPAEQRAALAITEPGLRAAVKMLGSDLFEGRAPATRGDALTQAYIATTFEGLGLEPAAPGGGYIQKVPLVGVVTDVSEPLRFTAFGKSLTPVRTQDYVVNAGVPEPQVRLTDAELVFVGYGIVAPEYGWDDYAGADVRGKVVLVMNNDPESDPTLFAGKTRLYYGRWTYKYEEAARHGAAGAIIIHTTPSAAYPWQVVQTSWSGEQFELPPAPGDVRVGAKLWVTEPIARALVAMGGGDLDALRKQAETRGSAPVALGVNVSVGLANKVSRVETANVIARLPGTERSGEGVLVTSHHDHLGVRVGVAPGDDAIYNGAVDNATGVAGMLAVARAFAALPERPRRSIYFAAVGAEEQGTIGSEWLARKPPLPLGKLAASINIDAMNVFGRTKDLTVVGLGKSTLDATVAGLARWQGREVKGDPHPDRGGYYRSDHFPLAKVGVPATYIAGGSDFVGHPAGFGEQTVEAWQNANYHQPSDEWSDSFDLSGMLEDARLVFFIAASVARAPEMPRWNAGDEFEATRKRTMQGMGAP